MVAHSCIKYQPNLVIFFSNEKQPERGPGLRGTGPLKHATIVKQREKIGVSGGLMAEEGIDIRHPRSQLAMHCSSVGGIPEQVRLKIIQPFPVPGC